MTNQESWQPIETAPKDGREILVAKTNGRWIASWLENWTYDYRYKPQDAWVIGGGFIIYPTHWQPLPAPPTDNGEKTQK